MSDTPWPQLNPANRGQYTFGAAPPLADTPVEQYNAAVEQSPGEAVGTVLPPAASGASEARRCLECGGEVDADGYCTLCGALAPSERDHFEESPASWVGGVCDRGVRHARNEDAMALGAMPEPGSRAIVVVCDGVSASTDSDVASLAGARAARGVLMEQRPVGIAGVAESEAAAMASVLTDAAAYANDAVAENTDPDSENPAAATFVACVVEGAVVHHGTLGDSRAYWIGDAGGHRLLTTDDSLAQEGIEAGQARKEAESGKDAHTITRWLGIDAVDVRPVSGVFTAPGDGWLLVCTDGLWNYASEAADLAAVVAEQSTQAAGGDPTLIARNLVNWAKAQGGHDNITAALVRIEAAPAASEPTDIPTTKTRPQEA